MTQQSCFFAVCSENAHKVLSIFSGMKEGDKIRLVDLDRKTTLEKISAGEVLGRHEDGCTILRYTFGEKNPDGIGELTSLEVLDEHQVMVVAGVATEQMILPTPGMVPLDSGACAGVEDHQFTSFAGLPS